LSRLGAPISWRIAQIATVSVQERRDPSKNDPESVMSSLGYNNFVTPIIVIELRITQGNANIKI